MRADVSEFLERIADVQATVPCDHVEGWRFCVICAEEIKTTRLDA